MGKQGGTTALKGRALAGAERRTAIVDAAMTVFAQRGFQGGALADVAERAGSTAANILYHFGSKEALLLAVIAERDRRAAAELEEMPIDGGLRSLVGTVRFAELCEREPGLATLHTVLQIESAAPGHPAADYFRNRSRLVRRRTEQVLRAAQEHGEVRADVDCAVKAREIVAFLEGAAVVWHIDRTVSLVQLYRDYFDGLVAAIGTTDA